MAKYIPTTSQGPFTITDKWFAPRYKKAKDAQRKGIYNGGDESPDNVWEGLGLKKFTGKFMDISKKKGPVNVESFREGELMKVKSNFQENIDANPKAYKEALRGQPSFIPHTKQAGLQELWNEDVKPGFKNFGYLVRHKWNVLGPGLETGAPIGGLLMHDYSKFQPTRFMNYARWFFGPKGKDSPNPDPNIYQKFRQSADEHLAIEDHHNYRMGEPMTVEQELEALADWYSVAETSGKTKLTFPQWFQVNKERLQYKLSPVAFKQAEKRLSDGMGWLPSIL